MPTSPYATAQISVNGGAVQTGGLTVAGASTIQLSLVDGSLVTSVRWEIYAYPLNWPTPIGWTLEASTGIIYSTDTTPTLITLEAASTRWGKWLVRVIGNGGTKNGVAPTIDPVTGSYLPNDLIDINSGWQVLSPTLGLSEVALFESTQYGGLRRWVDAIQKMQHAFESNLGAAHHTWVDTMLDGIASLTLTDTGNALVDVSGFTANRAMNLPASPRINQCITFKFTDASLASWKATINGNGAQVQGGTSDAAASFDMTGALYGNKYGSATFCFNGTLWETI